MIISENGLNLIKEFEGLRLKSYLCQAGVPTIGYGHTDNVELGQEIDEQKADEFLKEDIESFEKGINSLELNLNQNQFDALVSFSFNVGMGNLKSSTLLKLIRSNPNDANIRSQFLRWNKVKKNGKFEVSNGLMNRRIKEAELYFK